MSTTGIELGARNEKSDRHQVAMLNEMNSEQATAERFSSTVIGVRLRALSWLQRALIRLRTLIRITKPRRANGVKELNSFCLRRQRDTIYCQRSSKNHSAAWLTKNRPFPRSFRIA
jgi:hypothetical protein